MFFDESNVLTHVGSTLESKDTRIAAPWQDIYKRSAEPEPEAEKQDEPGYEPKDESKKAEGESQK